MKKLFLLLSFLILFGSILILCPEIWFRSSVVSFLLPKVMQKVGYDFSVSGFHASAHRLNWKTVRFNLSSDRVDLSSNQLKVHALKLKASIDVRWLALPPEIQRVENLQVNLPSVEIMSSDSENQALIALPSPPALFHDLEIGSVDISAPSIVVAPYIFNARILANGVLKASVQEENQNLGKTDLSLPLEPSGRPVWIKTQAQAQLQMKDQGKLTARISPQGCQSNEFCLDGSIQWVPLDRKSPHATADFKLLVNPNQWTLSMNAHAEPIASWIGSLATPKECVLKLNEPLSAHPQANLDCDLIARLTLNHFPPQADFKIRGSATSEQSGQVARYHGELNVDASSGLDPFFSVSINAQSRFKGELAGSKSQFHHETHILGRAEISESQTSKAILHETSWAIPAPLNNLNGKVQLTLQTLWRDWQTKIPLELQTHLDSPEQSLETQAKGDIEIGLQPKLSVKVSVDWNLNHVRLSVPRLDPKALPRFLADSDIKKNPPELPDAQEKKRPSVFNYVARINTPPGHPVEIDSDLVKTPVQLDIHADIESDKKSEVYLKVLPIDFEVFHRKGTLGRLNYALSESKKDGWVDGHIDVPSGDYRVGIHFQGTPDKIHVHLTSQPPMPEDQLWAVLLFGEPMEEITPDQQSSTEATSRAFSEGATDLVSFFLFSNTPIEKVNYDPTTNEISVSFHGPVGTTLKVGRSDLANGDIGLRKPIGKGFALDADVQRPTGDESPSNLQTSTPQSASVGAGIEWSTRY